MDNKQECNNSGLVLTLSLAAYAQAPVLIIQHIDESRLFTLAGNPPSAGISGRRGGWGRVGIAPFTICLLRLNLNLHDPLIGWKSCESRKVF
jgi:hypothetical protein